jgi:dCTP diphosphatase
MSEIHELQAALRQFAKERDWDQYHTPRNLSALISSEAGELLALFRWGQDATTEKRNRVEEEIADVFLAILRFADVAQVDLVSAANAKLQMNAVRYPADKHIGPDRTT